LLDTLKVNMRRGVWAILLLLLVLASVVLVPFAVVWAIGVLSGASVSYTIWTWFAAALLIGVVVLASKL